MKKTSNKFSLDWGKTLLAGAAIVQGFQYSQAFRMVHSGLGDYALAGGAFAGAVVVGAIAYAGNRLPGLKAKSARRWGVVFFATILALSPLVLTPVNYYSMDAGLRSMIGWYGWILAGLVASLPEIALGLVALVDRSLMSMPAVQAAIPIGKPAKKAAQPVQRLPVTVIPLRASKVDKEQLLAFLRGNPGASDSAIARNFGVSRQAIAGRRKQLTPQDLGLIKQEKLS
jgi:hypothetical protein